MPNYLDYRKSISHELISIKDRVRNFIDNRHWGEDGRYKEIILIDILKKVLPTNITVSTGFVICEREILSTQIDILIYRSDYPVLFKIDDFVIIIKESVLGIIEVKSTLNSDNIGETIEKSHKNGKKIGNHIFNGIFGYETDFNINNKDLAFSIKNSLKINNSFVNHICFGKDYFVRYWDQGNQIENALNHSRRSYSFYHLIDLAFGYFISNLIETILLLTNNNNINETFNDYLYPIKGTKERYRLEDHEIFLN